MPRFRSLIALCLVAALTPLTAAAHRVEPAPDTLAQLSRAQQQPRLQVTVCAMPLSPDVSAMLALPDTWDRPDRPEPAQLACQRQ